MAETFFPSAIHNKSSGDRPNRAERIPPPPPLSPRDHISALPDDLIHHIFSFLIIRDVVKTSVLSKRWQSTWTSIPNFVFDDGIGGDLPYSSRDFSSLVDSVLLQSTSPMVKEFHVTCDEVNSPKFDSWLRFAAERRVEHLRLWSPMFSYTLPQFVCHLSSLVRLEFLTCCFSLGTTIRWPCLKFLSMTHVELSDHILEEIVRGSPVLESLELHMCRGLKNIRINSTSVKELMLVYPLTCNVTNVNTLWAPHLLSLWMSGKLPDDSTFRLDDVSSLVEANLFFIMFRGERMLKLLKGLLEKLRGVPTIATSSQCFQMLSPREMEGVPSPLLKCQNLTLHAPVTLGNLPWIAHFLRSSPCLENLLISLDGWTQFQLELDDESRERLNLDVEHYLCSRNGKFECLGKHLKGVEIIGYEADRLWSNHLLALIKFLLGNALVLEKLIIKARLTRHVQKHLQAADLSKLYSMNRTVLSYQRASQNAEVIFIYRFNRVSR